MKIFDPKNRRVLTAVVAIIIVLAMVVPTVVSFLL